MRCEFQLICNQLSFEFVEDKIKEAISEYFDQLYWEQAEIKDLISSLKITKKYFRSIDTFRSIVGLVIAFSSITNWQVIDIVKYNELITNIGRKLQNTDNIELVLKFIDDVMVDKNKSFYPLIFEIEMKLREALSYILYNTYTDQGSYYNLLKEINVTLKPLKGKDLPKEDHFKKTFENELFFLIFSDYISLQNTKPISNLISFIDCIQNNDDYLEFKNSLLNRGITNPRYKKFLNDIKAHLEQLEIVRNRVAHNRTISDEEEENFFENKERIDRIIYEFWEEVNTNTA